MGSVGIHGTGRHGDSLRNVIRGGCKSPTYVSWRRMMVRCYNPQNYNYKNYGGKGVSVCDYWSDFRMFLSDMGPRPKGTTLGRVLDRGNYEPGNVFWMTRLEQGLHRRNNNSLRRWESGESWKAPRNRWYDLKD